MTLTPIQNRGFSHQSCLFAASALHKDEGDDAERSTAPVQHLQSRAAGGRGGRGHGFATAARHLQQHLPAAGHNRPGLPRCRADRPSIDSAGIDDGRGRTDRRHVLRAGSGQRTGALCRGLARSGKHSNWPCSMAGACLPGCRGAPDAPDLKLILALSATVRNPARWCVVGVRRMHRRSGECDLAQGFDV